MFQMLHFITTVFLILIISDGSQTESCTFPVDLKFGTSTAAYQTEGAWNEDGKGESIWDDRVHNRNNEILDGSTGDTAADSYHKYLEDVRLQAELGAKVYRFSISWPRIMPTGYSNKLNPAGIAHYSKLIDALLEAGIEPYITMYHWDLPLELQKIGGWVNPQIADYFTDYARVLLVNYGDRVKNWITINEPELICYGGYELGFNAPNIPNPGISPYLCAKTVLLAHAKTWKMFNEEFRDKQKGRMGITINTYWYEPKDPNSAPDREAAERALQFEFGWFADPVFFGDYPQVMKDKIAYLSKRQGFQRSRLPEFTWEEQNLLRRSLDFFGLNFYTSLLVSDNPELPEQPGYILDMGVNTEKDPGWLATNSSWLSVTPFGLRKVLKWIKDRYEDPEIVITENGMSEHALNDTLRVHYYNTYLTSMLEAIQEDEVNVTAYMAWTLLDDFEWASGYTERFGLIHVDFESEEKTRTPRQSFYNYQNIIKTRKVPNCKKYRVVEKEL